jgi:2-iminobutanoate/2-iminopropanoate deaminase
MQAYIHTENAPAAIGPYSQAVRAGDFLFTSGQIPLTKDGELVADNAAAQAEQSLRNIKAILSEAGVARADVVKTTVYLSHMSDFDAVNAVYGTFFASDAKPARSCVEVARLPKNVLVEIEAIAFLGD